MRGKRTVWGLLAAWLMATVDARAAEDWRAALRDMPLVEPVRLLQRANFAPILLHSFRSNTVVKALVLMPGATDEFYFFQRGDTRLGEPRPTLLDAVTALTHQTRIQATFRAPLLLLHTAEDPLDPLVVDRHPESVARLRATPFEPHFVFNDHDWDFVQPRLERSLGAAFAPPVKSRDSWHFYRHAVAGWNLSGWETLEALALAGKTTITVERTFFRGRTKVTFAPDPRQVRRHASEGGRSPSR